MIRLIIIKIIGCFHNFGPFFFFFFGGGGGGGVTRSGSMYVSEKLSTYPSPNLTFCPTQGASVDSKFGEG